MELLISSDEIAAKLKIAAAQISQDFQGKKLTIVIIMKGAICLASDLMRELHDTSFTVEYLKASSYGQLGIQQGKLTLSSLEGLSSIEGRDLLVVDDIFETGNTLFHVCEHLKTLKPSSIRTLILLAKEVERKVLYGPDYILFHIPNRFVVGYGLDYKELYRGLPGIYAFLDDNPPC